MGDGKGHGARVACLDGSRAYHSRIPVFVGTVPGQLGDAIVLRHK